MENNNYDLAVIGGGIVGAATAYKIQRTYPNLKIALFEKEDRMAPHQTGNNSGVIHSGIYYKPGSYKAKNCVDGRRELVEFVKEHKIDHDICGKLIVATDKKEIPFMEQIQKHGELNDVEGVERVNVEQMRDIEPEVRGIDGLVVGCTGIVDFKATTITLGDLVESINKESEIHLGCEVKDLKRNENGSVIKTNKGNFTAKYLVVCGGLFADRLAKNDGVKLKEKVVGFRGDYYELNEQAKHKVKNLIYPVPNPDFPFLGVHFTRMTDGEIECGPIAVFTFKREGYGKTDFSLRDTVDALSYKGTWNLLLNNFGFAVNEYRRAFSKKLFLKTLQVMIPSLTMDDIKPGRSGVRAMLLGEDGDTRDDFRIEYHENSIHVLNAPSPAATACLAIGEEVKNMAEQYFKLG